MKAVTIGIGRLQDALILQGAELGQSLGEPDEELIERIGVMPKNNHIVLPEQDQVSGLETAWVKSPSQNSKYLHFQAVASWVNHTLLWLF